jgi:hypothetical protein
VAAPKLVDYYAILNLPPRADLQGIENAYARLSDELALRIEVDETSAAALARVNEAYSVLSRPELRREYDRVFFGDEREAIEQQLMRRARRRQWARRMLVYSLAAIVVVQLAALIVLGHEEIGNLLHTALGPLQPGNAK